MRINPGGHLAPRDVVGRDSFIDGLWETLESQSVVLSAERRLGKTCVVQKMQAEPRAGFRPVYRDLEGVQTPLELAQRVATDVLPLVGVADRARMRLSSLLQKLGGEMGAGGLVLRLPETHAEQWKVLLETAVADACDHVGDKLVFLWDEVPLMVQKLARENPREAMDVMDVLRALRQQHPSLRMVFTGSIGLHGVLSRLRRAGHSNAPVNDMRWVELPPLSLADARRLGRELLAGIGCTGAVADDVATCIAEEVGCVPFYIHQSVKAIRESGESPSVAGARRVLGDALIAAVDAWEFHYYRARIDEHYESGVKAVALSLLDAACTFGKDGEPLSRLLGLAKVTVPGWDDEAARDVVTHLERDHYLVRRPGNRIGFRHPLVQRWWRTHRVSG